MVMLAFDSARAAPVHVSSSSESRSGRSERTRWSRMAFPFGASAASADALLCAASRVQTARGARYSVPRCAMRGGALASARRLDEDLRRGAEAEAAALALRELDLHRVGGLVARQHLQP